MATLVEPEEPRIIHRECGSVLAVSGAADPLRIGVAAETEAQARERFALSRARCVAILAEPWPSGEASSSTGSGAVSSA